MSKQPKPRWLIIDVSNWAYKDLFGAGPGPASLRNFTRRVELCRRELRPDRIVMAFDSDTSFRQDLACSYKATRREPPHGLSQLLESIVDYTYDQGFDFVQQSGFEADDCMATLTSIALDQNIRVVLASTDKDLRQLLVHGAVTILLKAEHGKTAVDFEYYNTTRLMEEYGLRPCQWVEYQMLVGDSCDNIGGCAGVGPKNAEPLLRSCSTLERFYASPFSYDCSDVVRRKVLAFRKGDADLTRKLVTLRHDVPLPAGWLMEAAS